MFNGPQETVRDNNSSSYSVFELPGVNCIYKNTCAFIFLWWNQKQPPEVFYKKAVLKSFAIFTRKHLCWSLFLIKLFLNFIQKRHKHRWFPLNIAKFLRTPILQNICELLLQNMWFFVIDVVLVPLMLTLNKFHTFL